MTWIPATNNAPTPHCNGTDKAALRLARLGLQVKVMIGGMTGWADEGFSFESSPATAAA